MNIENIITKEYEQLNTDERIMIASETKQLILQEFVSGYRKGLYAKIQKTMAYNSNKIEGSTLTSEQTASLFDTGTLYSNGEVVYRSKDIEEMTGHFMMFNHMLKTMDEKLSPKLIKEYHFYLKTGVFEDMANGYPVGEYKNRLNQVSDINTVLPKDVPDAIEKLFAKYKDSAMTIKDIAAFHAEYEKIHPFQDGNGRTGRMIIFRQCLDNGIIPIIIKDEYKMKYYNALHIAQVEGNYTNLEEFFIKQQEMLYEEIKNYLPQINCRKTIKVR